MLNNTCLRSLEPTIRIERTKTPTHKICVFLESPKPDSPFRDLVSRMSFRTFVTQFTPRTRPRARLATFNRDLTTSCGSFSFLRPWFPKPKILICLTIDSTMELPLQTNLSFSGGSMKPPTRISHSPRDCNMVRSKYLESSKKQLMIDIPGGKILLTLLSMHHG
jgi:hypothetical protein